MITVLLSEVISCAINIITSEDQHQQVDFLTGCRKKVTLSVIVV